MGSPYDSYVGAYLLGTLFNLFLTGINWSQMVEYLRCTVNERLVYRISVYVLMFVGMLHTITSIITIYIMDVHNFGDLKQFAACPWPFALDPILTAIIAFIAQSFFAYRVFILSGRKYIVPGFILLLTAVQLAIGVYCTAYAYMHPLWVEIAAIKWAVALWLFMMAFGDVTITAAIVFYLNRAKTGFEQTNNVIDKLVKHIIANNALTAIAACASSILFVGAPGAYHVIPGLLISKLYIVSLMASLNSRARLSENLNATRAQGRAYTSGVGSAFDGSAVDRSPDSPKRSRSHMHRSASMRSYNNQNVSYSQDLPIQVTVDSTSDHYIEEAWESDKHSSAGLAPSNHSPPFQQVMSLAVPENLR